MWNADFCQDTDGQDHHTRGRIRRHCRDHQKQDTRQGGHPPRPATTHLCRQTARRRAHAERLQHPEGVDPPPCSASPGRAAVPPGRAAVPPGRTAVPVAPQPPDELRKCQDVRGDTAARAPAAAHKRRRLRARAQARAAVLCPSSDLHRATVHAQKHRPNIHHPGRENQHTYKTDRGSRGKVVFYCRVDTKHYTGSTVITGHSSGNCHPPLRSYAGCIGVVHQPTTSVARYCAAAVTEGQQVGRVVPGSII